MSGPVVPSNIPIAEKQEVTHAEDVEKSILEDAIDPIAEKKLLWKVDCHVVPPLLILFLLAFLDRVNIGNAKIQGMTKELHMVGQDYSIALFIFFIP
jgi:MFS transporter, ACS family, DAL5 transporter family protein